MLRYLLPYTVAGLLLSVNEIAQRSGSEVTVHALREFAKCIDFGGPQSQPDHFSVHALVRLLEEKEQDCKGKEHTEFSLAKRHKHMG